MPDTASSRESAPSHSRATTFIDRVGARARLGMIGRPSGFGVALIRHALGPLVRVAFRPTGFGWENLTETPSLLVLNHSGGGIVDVLALVALWSRRFGSDKKTTGMAHPLAFFVPLAALFLRSMGAIPSTREHALAAFKVGASVIIFPGGDHEGFRPIWQASLVDWNGRVGFARLARDAWVPVVPVGIRGTSYTAPILWRSSLLCWLLVVPRVLGIKRMPLSVFWLAGLVLIGVFFAPSHSWAATAGFAYLWSICPFAWQLPWLPWSVSLHIGQPLSPEQLFGSRESTAPVTEAAERVRSEVQKLVAG